MKNATRRVGALLLLVSLLALTPGVPVTAGAGATGDPGETETARNAAVRFEANQGQTDPAVEFVSRGPGHAVFLAGTETVFVLAGEQAGDRAASGEAVRMRLTGANDDPEVEASDVLPGLTNYFLGNNPAAWVTGVRSYGRVRYSEVYPGIDVVYYGNADDDLEYDFVVSPGADPRVIGIDVDGGTGIALDDDGNLIVTTSVGEVRQKRPILYQQGRGGAKHPVDGRYILHDGTVTFDVGDYDPNQPLVIDPVLTYSTYLGGSGNDEAAAVAVDHAGHSFVVGSTISIDFPTIKPTHDSGCGTDGKCNPTKSSPLPDSATTTSYDAFVTKLAPDGSAFVSSTYIGGAKDDHGTGVAVDAQGNAYVTGMTQSADFPTPNAFDATCGTDGQCNPSAPSGQVTQLPVPDAFVTKLPADLSALSYSTYLGGSGREQYGSGTYDETNLVGAIAVDKRGHAFVTGRTFSSDFPKSSDALDGSCGTDGNCNKVERKLCAFDICTEDPRFPGSGGAYDAFVTELTADGSRGYSSFLGGSGHDNGSGIAVLAAGEEDAGTYLYVTGTVHHVVPTSSTTFPTTPGALRRTAAGNQWDAFVTKLRLGTTPEMVASTFLGADVAGRFDFGHAVAADVTGYAYVTGRTSSTGFPTCPTPDTTGCTSESRSAFQPEKGDPTTERSDAFLAKLTPDLSSLAYGTYLGGSSGTGEGSADTGADSGLAIAVDASGRAYVTGFTASYDDPTVPDRRAFPTTPDALRRSNSRSTVDANETDMRDAFVAVVDPAADGVESLVYSTYLGGGEPHPTGGRTDDTGRGIAVDARGTVSLAGWTQTRDFPWVNAAQPSNAGQRDGFVVRLSPVTGFGADVTPVVTGLAPARGRTAGGTKVTITGAGFRPGASVMFGEIPGTDVSVLSPTRITAVSPPQAEEEVMATVRTIAGTSPPAVTARFSYHEGAWVPTMGRLSQARYNHTATLLRDGRVLVAGGVARAAGTTSVATPLASVELYDPRTGMWSLAPLSLNVARHRHTATLLGDGRVLVTGGASCGAEEYETCPLDSAELYNPATGAWTSVAGAMSFRRRNHTATLLPNGLVLVAGGVSDEQQPRPDDQPVGEAVPALSFVAPRSEAEDALASRAPSEVFDPASNRWRQPPAGPLNEMRLNHTATPTAAGTVLAVGGSNYGGMTAGGSIRLERVRVNNELFDPATGVWRDAESHSIPRQNHTMTPLPDGRLVLAGGWSGNANSAADVPVAASEVFDPAAPPEQAWSLTGPLRIARTEHAATPLPGGRVMVTGGKTGRKGSHQSSPTKGVIVTGAEGEDGRRSNAEVFQPALGNGTGGWFPAEPMSEPKGRARHTATLLSADPNEFKLGPQCGASCGKVLVVGGSGSDEAALASSELYTPAPVITGVSPTAGQAGERVTVEGAGFTDDLPQEVDARGAIFGGVAFGADRATIVQTSTETITYDRMTVLVPIPTGDERVPVTLLSESGLARSPALFSYTGLPGAVRGLGAVVVSAREVHLEFGAPGVVGDAGPPAAAYVVRKSRHPLSPDNLGSGERLCEGGVCRDLKPGAKGERLTLKIDGLVPETVYHFAVQAMDEAGNLGPASFVSARTSDVTPGAVSDLAAAAVSDKEVRLTFSAIGSNGDEPPPTKAYIVKQSNGAIVDGGSFAEAKSLCGGLCRFDPPAIGEVLALSVTGLHPGTTYHYALRPVDDAGNAGPVSNVVSVTTQPACPDASPAPGTRLYPSGYALLALPGGTVVPAQSPLYGWFDSGEGSYQVHDAAQPVPTGRGFWAWFSCPRAVEFSGAGTPSVQFGLGAYRASMVGNPSGTSVATLSGHDFVATWDPALDNGSGGYHLSGLRQPVSLAVGEGAWAFSYRQTTLSIDAR